MGRKYRAGFSEFPLITRHSPAEKKRRRVRILLAQEDVIRQEVALQILPKIGYGRDVAANGR